MELTFAQLRGLSGKTDITDVPCPLCLNDCKTNEGRKRKCLRIWDNGEDFITFQCARCCQGGYAKPDDGSTSETTPKVEKNPVEKQDKSGLCQFLWDKSVPAIGSIVQTYLETRQCWRACPNIRFLAGREYNGKRYEPAMISRFGFEDDPVTGVHLTKLRPDGRGKAGTDADKLTMGDTVGQPIVIHTNDDSDEILIAEGIEDTESLVMVAGWTGWAAGTANRIPAVVATAVQRGYRKIYVAQDMDHIKNMETRPEPASKRALAQAHAITPVIPLWFGGLITGRATSLDANKLLISHGSAYVMAAIQWCDAQEMFRRGLLNFHQFKHIEKDLLKILQPRT